MYIISKTIKGQEFIYSKKHTILCKSRKQAETLAKYLNEHNDTSIGEFKLKDNEKWHTYFIDKYDPEPIYKVGTTKGKISIKENTHYNFI